MTYLHTYLHTYNTYYVGITSQPVNRRHIYNVTLSGHTVQLVCASECLAHNDPRHPL